MTLGCVQCVIEREAQRYQWRRLVIRNESIEHVIYAWHAIPAPEVTEYDTLLCPVRDGA
jgi:hypothetical protein